MLSAHIHTWRQINRGPNTQSLSSHTHTRNTHTHPHTDAVTLPPAQPVYIISSVWFCSLLNSMGIWDIFFLPPSLSLSHSVSLSLSPSFYPFFLSTPHPLILSPTLPFLIIPLLSPSIPSVTSPFTYSWFSLSSLFQHSRLLPFAFCQPVSHTRCTFKAVTFFHFQQPLNSFFFIFFASALSFCSFLF